MMNMILVESEKDNDEEEIFNERNWRENYFIVCYYIEHWPRNNNNGIWLKTSIYGTIHTQSKCIMGI